MISVRLRNVQKKWKTEVFHFLFLSFGMAELRTIVDESATALLEHDFDFLVR